MNVAKKTFVPAGASISIEVGVGGAASGSNGGAGGKGGSSVLQAGDVDVEAFGGGGGGGWNSTSPSSGGSIASSGGSANKNTTAHIDGWNYDSSQGHPGGISYNGNTNIYGPGGGGSFWPGAATISSASARSGGQGSPYFVGAAVGVYGAGGGGGGTLGGYGGINAGAGGNGTAATNHGAAGTDGFGGGGGGGGNNASARGGAGGAGAVILSIAEGDTTAKSLEIALPEQVIYVGTTVTPEPVVTLNGVTLEKDVDYTVTYQDNAAIGFGGVLVTGIDGTAAEGLTATRTFIIYKGIFAASAGAGNADGSSWANAMAPQAALTAAQTSHHVGYLAAVLFKSGDYTLSAALTFSRPGLVLGGFLGADGVSLELDESNPETVFDGGGIASKSSTIDQALTVSAGFADTTNVFERCAFGRFKSHGFVKTGASSIAFRKCRFFNNCWGPSSASQSGRGFSLTGTKDAVAIVDDCEISGQILVGKNTNLIDTGAGFGGYISTFRRVYIDNSLFVTNGWEGNWRSAQGSALYVTGAPVTMRNTRIVANQLSHPASGGTFCLVGASGGSAFTNCLWVANANRWYNAFGNGGNSGALRVGLNSAADTVDLDHCTFAYNLQGSKERSESGNFEFCSAAGLNVIRGKVKVRNSIFWGNSISTENRAAADVYIHAGSADIDYTLFGGLSTTYLKTYSGATIALGDHIIVGDPNFATTPDEVFSRVYRYVNGSTIREFKIPRSTLSCTEMYFKSTTTAVQIDAHVVTDAAKYSPAIDGSIPSWPVGAEPAPNGGVANLGFYGTTAEAATSILGEPTIVGNEVDVTFPPESAGPAVAFELGGDGTPYNATARVEITGDGKSWSQEFAGLKEGDEVTSLCPVAFTPGSSLTVRVTVSAPGQADVVVTENVTAAGEVPAWYGHGGDSNKVVHVRAGSTAVNPRGTSWADAFPDLVQAMSALTSTRDEIWFAGTLSLTASPDYFRNGTAATIRGGFTGVEDSADERVDGATSTIDGNMRGNCFKLLNQAKLTFERVDFRNGYSRAVYRDDCKGDLEFVDCGFYNNGATNTAGIVGAAVYFYRSTHPAANLAFRRCRFEGNGRRFNSNAQLDGACIYINNAASLTVEDSLFITNGAPFSLSSSNSNTVRPAGTCIYADATPVTVTGCRFAGNRSSSGTDGTATYGGLIYLLNACDGSVIRNCAFVANECVTRTATASKAGTLGGSIVVNFAEAIREMSIENCTFAWNLSAGYSFPADVSVNKGIANVHNCVFSGGQLGPGTVAGIGRYFKIGSAGSLNIDYSMFDCDFETAIGGSGSIVIAPSCITNANPCFVTSSPELTLRNPSNFYAAYDAGVESVAATCDVHLVSAAGYVDNDGVFHTGGDVVSPAIDAGDPTDDYANEPMPNGSFINLGAYGNTVEASRTYSVEPEIVDDLVTVTFPDDTSFPQVDFDLKAAALDYTATVKMFFGTNGFDAATFESPALPIRGGEHFTYLQGMEPYVSGSTLYVRVLVTSGEHVLTNDVTATVTGEMPAWWGKGGGEHVIHVWADAPGAGDGTSWKDAYHDIHEAFAAYNSNIREIWLVGDYRLTATLNVTTLGRFALRGGFTGAENAPEERPAAGVSRLDGNNTYDTMKLVNTSPAELDRVTFFNAYNYGIDKTGGGDLALIGCSVLTNGQHGTYSSHQQETDINAYGKGLRISSAAGANVLVTNCLFMGNMLIDVVYDNTTGKGGGAAIYADNGASLTIVDSLIYGNGHPNETPSTSHSGNARAGAFPGGAVYSKIPTFIRGSRICGNRWISHGGSAGIVALRAGAGGSRIENCVFAANAEFPNGNTETSATLSGAIAVSLSTRSAVVDVVNCTFAYNLCDSKNSAAGITVNQGTVNVKNCVFGGNFLGVGAADRAVDINVKATGTCNVSYTLLSPDDAVRSGDVATFCAIGGELNIGPGVAYGDPLFVTEIASITNLVQNFNAAHMLFNPSRRPDWAMQNVDAHVLSESGYFTNDGTEHEAEAGVLSPAIDTGDPFDPLRDEYVAPENLAINQGAYGGTRWASKSASGHAEVDGNVLITFPTEFTQPQVEFTVGGEGTFIASATIFLSSDGGLTWDYVSDTIGNLVLGQTVTLLVPLVYEPGTLLTARVVLVANGMDDAANSQATMAEGELPPWYGHGGDPTKVVHVREGAFGAGDGTSWADAVSSIHEGMTLLTAERNEIWVANTNNVSATSVSYNFDFPVVVRGGFDGHEDALGDRYAGARSTVTGNRTFANMTLANSQPVYVERIVFDRGSGSCFKKSGGAGDLAMVDCSFENGCSTSVGAGGYFAGNSGKTACLALTNCVFRGNRFEYGTGYAYNQSGSKTAYFANFAKVTIEGCLFVDNGTGFGYTRALSAAEGVVIKATGCRLEVANSRFVANSDFMGGVGGFISLQTGTSGSVFRNCVFAGNVAGNDNSYGVGAGGMCSQGGIIHVTGNFEERPQLTIDHCTFAYNPVASYGCPGAIYVHRGIVNVSNCVFHANMLSSENSCPADIYVRYENDDPLGAQCHVSYCMFDDLGTNNIRVATGGIITTNNLYVADPLLVTTLDDLLACLPACTVSGARLSLGRNSLRFTNNAATLARLEAFNMHLRSRAGWYDERTGEWCSTSGAPSPAIDAGDPAADYSKEPNRAGVGFPGRRVNLGAYGNTPWASMTPHPGNLFILR
ncbi:MAG: right-handed parallel beta-helix repeat-containing protein [Kiritimatiellae bacterium]|nr:right-handed parallel beta-helix repeat-containing protein [Kiritimatiellia bacterium]